MFKNRQILSFIAHAIATLVAIYFTSTLIQAAAPGLSSGDSATAAGTAIGVAILAPGVIMVWISALLGWLGFFLRVPGLTLTAAILYIVTGFVGLLMLALVFLLPSIVLAFIGWSKEAAAKKA
jgi:hypothetical protein